jgi:outer membrane protein
MKSMCRMRRLIPGLLALSLGAAHAAAQESLTLAQAVRKALESNPDLAMDAPARAAADSELAASRAGYRPRLDFEQSVLGGNNPVYVFGTRLTQRAFTADDFALPSLNRPDALQNLQTRISAQQNVWDFGRTKERVDTARLGIEIADWTHQDNIRRVILGVVEAYYSVALAHEAQDAARTALASAEAIVKQAQARVESGLAIEADLLRGQVQLAAARQMEIQARGQVEMFRAALNRFMGLPLDSPLGAMAPLARANYPLPGQETMLVELRKRPDYQRLQGEVRQAELEVRGRQTQFWPILGAFASWEADHPSFKDAGGSNWAAGLTLRWNLYAGGSSSAMLQASRQRLEQKRRQLEAMESAMQLEVHQALVRVRTAEQQVQAMQAAEQQSQESLRILRNRYEAGLATMTDLLAAETARSYARTALAEAIFRHRLGFAQLQYALGTLSPNSEAVL